MGNVRFAVLAGRGRGKALRVVAFALLLVVLMATAGCSLFTPRGTVVITNESSDRVYCEFLWGPENKSIYVDAGATESCSVAAGSYRFYVTKAEGGEFVMSLYIELDANTTQPITIVP